MWSCPVPFEAKDNENWADVMIEYTTKERLEARTILHVFEADIARWQARTQTTCEATH